MKRHCHYKLSLVLFEVAFERLFSILEMYMMTEEKTFPVLVPHYSEPGANFVIKH